MSFRRPFLAVAGLGLVGVLSLAPSLGGVIAALRAAPGAPDLPAPAWYALLLAQPAVLVLIGAALGAALAERIGLVSVVAARVRGQRIALRGLGSTLGLAALLATLVAAVELVLRARYPGSFAAIQPLHEGTLPGRIAALLYGGIAEEVMMRYGLMTLLAWIGLRLTRGRGRPWVLAAAIGIAALVFAAGHLPALMSVTTPDGVLVARTLALNGVLGVFYGSLYARRTLEHAMLAHAATHGVFWTATPLLMRVSG